jgi:hypothetical protein
MDGSRWFWPIVVGGTAATWLGAWVVSQNTSFRLPLAAVVVAEWLVAALCGAVWYRADPSLLAAGSIALPLAVLWTVDALLGLPRVASLAIWAAGFGGFLALASSHTLTAWWYRFVLRSRRDPPR